MTLLWLIIPIGGVLGAYLGWRDTRDVGLAWLAGFIWTAIGSGFIWTAIGSLIFAIATGSSFRDEAMELSNQARARCEEMGGIALPVTGQIQRCDFPPRCAANAEAEER